MKKQRKCIFYGVCFLAACIAILIYILLRNIDKPMGRLGISVYIKNNDKNAVEPVQQVVCLLDDETMDETHLIHVVNGSYIMADIKKPNTLYSVSEASYGTMYMDSREDDFISAVKINTISLGDGGEYDRNAHLIPSRGGTLMAIENEENKYWFGLNEANELYFRKRDIENEQIGYVQTSLFHDEFSGWDWPSESMTVSQNGDIAAVENEDSWTMSHKLVIANPELSQYKEYSIAGFFGPISWKSNTELFLWKHNPVETEEGRQSYTLHVFDKEKEITYPHITQTGKMIVANGKPFASMAVNTEGTKIAYWKKAEKYAALVYLTCVDLQTGEKTQAEFKLNLEEGRDGVYEYTYGEETIYLPYDYYIPTIFFVD